MAAKITLVSLTLLLAQLLLLVLLLTPTTTATATATSTSTTVPAGVDVDEVPALPLPLPLPTTEDAAAVADCWKAVLQAEGCAIDILRWLASPELAVGVGGECCGVLVNLGDRCIHDLFPDSALGRLYSPILKHACGTSPAAANPGSRQ